MKKLLILLSILILSFGLNSCDRILNDVDDDIIRDEPLPVAQIIFGTFYGMCQGEQCIETFLISGDLLLEDTLDNYPSIFNEKIDQYDWQPYEGSNMDAYTKVSEIYNSYESMLWESESAVYGCPDCRDQGGVFIKIQKNGEAKSIIVDNDYLYEIDTNLEPLPDQIKAIAKAAKDAVEEFNK